MNVNQSKWPQHLYALDFSRGIAALSVVLWHWQHFAYTQNNELALFQRETQPFYGLFRIFYEAGAMGVQYFFVLSGFIFFWLYASSINTQLISGFKFAIQRFSRLYPLHFATLIFVAILQTIYMSLEDSAFIYKYNDVYHFILNLLFATRLGLEDGPSYNAQVWSVSVEIVLYFIFFFTLTFRRGGWFFCLSISLASLIAAEFTENVILSALSLFFFGGAVFYITKFASQGAKLLKLAIYSATIFFWLIVIFDFYIFNISDDIVQQGILGKIILRGFSFYILFPFTISSLCLFEVDNGNIFKSLSWIGDISYSSYLIHFPLQLLFAIAVSCGILEQSFYLSSMYLIVFFLILIPISYITFHRFERPAQSFLRKKLLYKSKKEIQTAD
jgi:peptidoglycan/LPS O-acetylase OafA/YrhL